MGAPFLYLCIYCNIRHLEMMRPLWIGVLLSSVVLVSVDAQTLNLGPKPACFDDLDVLQEYVEAKNPLETEDFILCPNTVFHIGNPRSDASCCENGSAPLQLGPNTHYKCGADGTSTNNCTLTGGLFQVLATAPSRDQEEIITNSVVEGVTFRGGGGAGTLMVSNNNVTFRDCIFTEHGQHGAVNLLYMAAGTRRLLEIERREEKSKQLGRFLSYFADLLERPEELLAWQNQRRVLQTDHTRQRLTLDSCVFKNNTYGESNQTNVGIVRAGTKYNDLIVKNCVFENNAFGDTERVVRGPVFIFIDLFFPPMHISSYVYTYVTGHELRDCSLGWVHHRAHRHVLYRERFCGIGNSKCRS